MNIQKKLVLLLAGGLLFLTIICPPFQYMGRSLGHHWIGSDIYNAAVIDAGKLMTELVAIGLITSIAYLGLLNSILLSKKYPLIQKRVYLIAIPIVRIVRIFVWISVIWISFGAFTSFIFEVSVHIQQSATLDFGKIFVILIAKIIAALFLIGLFFCLRIAIDFFHLKCHGIKHQGLTTKWSL